MLSPDELSAKVAIPALRAIIAKKLVAVHGLSQVQAARLLGITQAAVSNYTRGVRGCAVSLDDSDEIRTHTTQIADLLTQGADEVKITLMLTRLSQHVKQKRMLCGIHKQMEPDLDVDACHICDETTGNLLYG